MKKDFLPHRGSGVSTRKRHRPANVNSTFFKVGDRIEFTYRELSDDGLPKEARFQRGAHSHA